MNWRRVTPIAIALIATMLATAPRAGGWSPGSSIRTGRALMRGKKSALSRGIVQVRFTVGWPEVPDCTIWPPRNHTGPDCPTPH
jgi:hypothetical protein